MILTLSALAVLPYLNSLRNQFVYDDDLQILQNPTLRSFHFFPQIFTSTAWSFLGGYRGTTDYYRPLMSLGYMICYRLFGLRPLGFHLANVLGNLAVVWLVFLLGRRLLESAQAGVIAAALFAVHPIHTEAVAWVGGVTEIELAFFFLLAFWFFLEAGVLGGAKKALAELAMTVSFALALLSKEQAVMLPVLATLYAIFAWQRHDVITRARMIAPCILLWLTELGYLLARIHWVGPIAPVVTRPALHGGGVAFAALALVGQYVWKLLWPVHLSAYSPFPRGLEALLPWTLMGGAELLLAGVFVAWTWKRARPAALGVVWFFATLAPVLNARWMPINVFSERYLYLPSVGFCWAVAALADRWWQSLARYRAVWRRLAAAVAAVLVILEMLRIVTRNRDWRNDLTFDTATLAAAPGAFDIRNNLGVYYWNQGNVSAAQHEWREAYKLSPNDSLILLNLGLAARREVRYGDAIRYFQRVLAIVPNDAEARLNLGLVYESLERWSEAQRELEIAVALAPLNPRAHNALGEYDFDRKAIGAAEAQFKRSISLAPTLRGYWDLGFVYWMKGKIQPAEDLFKRAEALDPKSAKSHFILAVFYKTTGRTAKATEEYQAGLRLDPNNAQAIAAFQRSKNDESKSK